MIRDLMRALVDGISAMGYPGIFIQMAMESSLLPIPSELNARAYLDVESSSGFAPLLWSCVNDQPIQNHWKRMDQVPASAPQSDAMSRELKKRGFRFVGSTICYAFMQSVGMVNDHLVSCPRHAAVAAMGDTDR